MSSQIIQEFKGLAGAGLLTFGAGVVCGVILSWYASHNDIRPQADMAVSTPTLSAEGEQFLKAWCAANYKEVNNDVR